MSPAELIFPTSSPGDHRASEAGSNCFAGHQSRAARRIATGVTAGQ